MRSDFLSSRDTTKGAVSAILSLAWAGVRPNGARDFRKGFPPGEARIGHQLCQLEVCLDRALGAEACREVGRQIALGQRRALVGPQAPASIAKGRRRDRPSRSLSPSSPAPPRTKLAHLISKLTGGEVPGPATAPGRLRPSPLPVTSTCQPFGVVIGLGVQGDRSSVQEKFASVGDGQIRKHDRGPRSAATKASAARRGRKFPAQRVARQEDIPEGKGSAHSIRNPLERGVRAKIVGGISHLEFARVHVERKRLKTLNGQNRPRPRKGRAKMIHAHEASLVAQVKISGQFHGPNRRQFMADGRQAVRGHVESAAEARLGQSRVRLVAPRSDGIERRRIRPRVKGVQVVVAHIEFPLSLRGGACCPSSRPGGRPIPCCRLRPSRCRFPHRRCGSHRPR